MLKGILFGLLFFNSALSFAGPFVSGGQDPRAIIDPRIISYCNSQTNYADLDACLNAIATGDEDPGNLPH